MRNYAEITGVIVEDFTFSHEFRGVVYYKSKIASQRTTKKKEIDTIPFIVSELVLRDHKDMAGERVTITGSFHSRNTHDEEGTHHLELFLFAKSLLPAGNAEDKNNIYLSGVVCKKPVYRTTLRGREITDIMVAVERKAGASSYLPCICWSENAVVAGTYRIGDCISGPGRIQSREYIKRFTDGSEELKTAYEVSFTEIAREKGKEK